MGTSKSHLAQIWKLLNTDVKELLSLDTVKTTAESGKAVLELGKTLKEQGNNIQLLSPVLANSQSLLDILCSPLAQLMGAGLPFVPITIAMLQFYREKTRQEPTLESCVAVVSQAAYLESFLEILSLPENQNILAQFSQETPNLASLQKLGNFELDSQATRQAISSFPDSQLAQAYNQVLSERLQQAGLSETEARIFTERVARNSNSHFFAALTQAGDAVKQLSELYHNGGIKTIKKYDSLDQYLKTEIASNPDEPVFNEDFTFRDIYVPPKARKVDSNGKIDEKADTFDLETWVKNALLDSSKNNQRQVIFIQGGPGRGKSVFCRMFADWVRQYLHPMWTPILIRLRDIEEFQPYLEETLRSRIKADFAQNDDGWLTDSHNRFLFILDGFDELRIERSNNQSVERFIRQVGTFQHDYCQKHRVLITGRAMALHGIDRLPANLERVEIVEMDAGLQNQWFSNWRQQFNTDKTREFQQFLQDELPDKNCPLQVQELAKEPLLLYMLAAMHRDDALDISQFEQATATAAKILIYEKALEWVLQKQRSDIRHPELNEELTRLNPEALRRLLAEAALCVVQTGGESASMQMVKARIQQDDEVRELITQAETKLGEESLKTALSAFYLKSNNSGGVEFFHKSFREFLFAEKLKASLEEWTAPGRRGKSFYLDDNQLHWQIYDLLGYGGLTPEIVEYLFGLLDKDGQEFRPVQLFARLEDFYQRWCEGEFIDAAPAENLPQKKMLQLQGQNIVTGLRQVDIYAGLNVMILLLELHRYALERDELKAQIHFYPSGNPDENKISHTAQLIRIINYSDCIQLGNFNTLVGQFLSGANLSGAYLSVALLSGAILNGAILNGAMLLNTDLRGADLRDAMLIEANLSEADLRGADLRDAMLINANLTEADLRGAILSEAVLSCAILSGANLSGANLSGVDLENITWDKNTNWEGVRGLDTARNVPEALKQQLGLQ